MCVSPCKEGDQVFQDYGGYDRPEKIYSFLKNVEEKHKVQIRVTALTIEGAPIITELVFDGEAIEYKRDTRQDGFGAQKLYEKRCRPEFTIMERDGLIEYALENCYGTSGAYGIFYFPKE
ncbi:uncharacterized protein DUF4362 [Tumebacillus sp. BK434]|nr:uncharacterized protein DUF4362 [Tumebacillus sp. BK434]